MHLLGRILKALAGGDAEKAHDLGVQLGCFIQRHPWLLRQIAAWHNAEENPKPRTVWGIPFPNRIGWASGFDKGGHLPLLLQACGFGFGMVGTVLPKPQYGQDKPRYFYLPEDKALINRFGFNSEGVRVVAQRINRVGIRIPLGASLGKMKDTPNEQAVEDYIAVWRHLRPFVRFGVANISSPNTAGLRDLQGGRYLEHFVTTLVNSEKTIAKEAGVTTKPIIVKIAPDLEEKEIDEVVEAIERGGASGIVVGNTTIRRDVLRGLSSMKIGKEGGGLSGHPAFDLTRKTFGMVRKRTKKPMVFVGGVDCVERARVAFDDGADLVKILTPFVYHGTALVDELRLTR